MTADTPTLTASVTAIILAGGHGARMQHRNKGLVELAGRHLVRHVIDRIAPQVAQVVIVANRDLDVYRRYGYPVLRDEQYAQCGPLAGIASGLQHVTTDLVLIVPCDMPLLPDDIVTRLAARMDETKRDAVYVHDGIDDHYLVALAKRETAATVNAFLAQDGRAARAWWATVKPAVASFAGAADAFDNVNTPAALARLAQRIGSTTEGEAAA